MGQFTEALARVHTAPAAAVSRPRLRAWLAAGLRLVLLLGVVWLTTRGHQAAGKSAATGPSDQKYVVAVLPFESLSADSARHYFAAGMAEEITGQLSRLSALRVLGRNALTSYTNAADRIPRMVKDLGVGASWRVPSGSRGIGRGWGYSSSTGRPDKRSGRSSMTES